MLYLHEFAKKTLALLVLTFLIQGTAAFAQKKAAPAAKCTSSAWTGIVTYKRSQSMTHSKTEQRVSNRGEDKTNFEMKYEYKAEVAVVESPEKNGSSDAKATIDMSHTSKETVVAKEKNSCDRGKTWKEMSGTSTSTTETTGNGQDSANFNVGVNTDGTYTVSVGVPQIQGKVSGSQTSSFSGQCTPKEGKNLTTPATPTTIEGGSITSDGKDKIDPKDPDKISGSYTHAWQNVTETITWNLEKCGAPLRLVDIEFEDMRFPTWNDWKEISEQVGTVDGNLVKIKAKLFNASAETKYGDIRFKETFKGDKWDGAKPDAPLKDEVISASVEAGEIRDVEIIWDSSGYAWYDDGRPRLTQRIKAELEENGRKTDEIIENLKVAPKPVVLVHGLWSNWKAWESWQNILTTSHSYDWKAFPVGEKPDKGVMNTGSEFLSTGPTNAIFENSQQLGKYIKYAQEDRNAWHVDIVAHSMGGLISRHYIHSFMPPPAQDGRPQVSHLVMLGTPNMGSPCADVMNTAFETLGKNVEAVRQLRQDVAAEFNRVYLNRKGVKYSVLAGNPLPTMCKSIVWNDGVVPVPSAKWQIADNAESTSLHTDLTGTSDFSAFVKPRLAIGPKGNHDPEAPQAPRGAISEYEPEHPRNMSGARDLLMNGMFGSAGTSGGVFAKAQKIAPGQTAELEIPVEAAQNFGLTFMAAPSVSVTLVDNQGAVMGKNLAGSPESRGLFRSIYVDTPVGHGTWKLRVENTGTMELEIVLTTWADAVK